jgi:hypothetical protein
MDRNNCFGRRDFDNHAVVNQNIDSAAGFDQYLFVPNRQLDLTPKLNLSFREFLTPAGLVGRLEKSWPQGAVHCYGSVNGGCGNRLSTIRKLVLHLPIHLRALRAFVVKNTSAI